MSIITVFLIVIMLTNSISAQVELIFAHQLTKEEGLSQSTNAFLHIDSHNLVWISSMDGLNVFNGKEIKSFKSTNGDQSAILGNNIQSNFFEDRFNNIWFTTEQSINCFNRKQGSFIFNSVLNKNKAPKDSLGFHYAFYLEKNKYLWVVANKQLICYDILTKEINKKPLGSNEFYGPRCAVKLDSNGAVEKVMGFYVMKPSLEIISIDKNHNTINRDTILKEFKISKVISGTNKKAIALSDKGLLLFDPNDPINYEILSPENKKVRINDIIDGSDRHFIVLCNNSEIFFLDKVSYAFSKKAFKLFHLEKREILPRIDYLLHFQDSTLWVSTYEKGVLFAHLKNNRFIPVFLKNQLLDNKVEGLLQDYEGNLWCYSRNGNLWIFDPNQNLLKYERIKQYSKLISARDNSVIGVSQIEDSFSNKKLFSPFVTPEIKGRLSLVDYNNRFCFIGGSNGLFLFDKKEKEIQKKINLNFTVQLYLDSHNRLWTVNASGQIFVYKINKIPEINIELLTEISEFRQIHGFCEDIIRSKIWIASSEGLVQINSYSFEVEKLINRKYGLRHEFIYAVVVDQQNTIWLSTNAGIVRFIPENDPKSQFELFTTEQGLSSNEYTIGAGLLLNNGNVCFGSTKGVDIIRVNKIKGKIGKAPTLSIDSLKINGKPWIGDSAIGAKSTIPELKHNQNTLTFELAASEYTNPKENKYWALLQSKNQIDSAYLHTDNEIRYPFLPPGNYTLNFFSANSEGILQTTPLKFEFQINPPFYQTWWFLSLSALAAIGLVSFITSLYYRFRLGKKQLELEKQERKAEKEKIEAERMTLALEKRLFMETERSRIAGEMHDEIGSGLSTIYNATTTSSKKENIIEIKSILSRIAQISTNLISNMRSIIWAMDPEYDTLDDLCAYIRRSSREFLDDNNLEAKIDIPIEIPKIDMNGKTRHNIVLTIKEALHNVVKHADATSVQLELSINDLLLIQILDNGKGFDRNKVKRQGHGLRNMSNRIQSIKGEIYWRPNIPQGTIIDIRVPIKSSPHSKSFGSTKP